jgi:predicted ATP-grasp superfamily ATP-dependent carboligase
MKPVIGQLFYKVASPTILHYKVIGIRQYETGDLYELECQSCTHSGAKCQVLAGFDDHKVLQVIHMLNDNEDEPQHYWHERHTGFYPSIDEALLERAYMHRREAHDDLKKAEELLERRKLEVKRLNETVEALIAKTKKPESPTDEQS